MALFHPEKVVNEPQKPVVTALIKMGMLCTGSRGVNQATAKGSASYITR